MLGGCEDKAGGLGGNLLSAYHAVSVYQKTGYANLSAGASGAIFALAGAMLVLLLLHKGQLEDLGIRRMFLMVAISIYVGFEGSNIDNYAHIGGLICGMIGMGLLAALRQLKNGWKKF